MRLGFYGGSFDPVHIGHLLVARAAMEEASLDRLLFIPAAQSPFKPDRQLAPDKDRLQLLRLALAGETKYGVDAQELDRGGVSYTIDTVRNLRDAHPKAELFCLIGADHVPLLTKWRDARELSAAVEFLVIPRPGQEPTPFPAGFAGSYLKGTPIGLSSSLLRERIKTGLPIDLLTKPAVAEAIKHKGLYL